MAAVAQHEQPVSAPPSVRASVRYSLTTTAAIRRGEIKISRPIPVPDEKDLPSAGVAASAVSPQDTTRLPRLSNLNDGRLSSRGTVVNTSAGGQPIGDAESKPDLSKTREPQGGKSVQVQPSQQLHGGPRQHQKRASMRMKPNTPIDRRFSTVMNQDLLRASYETSLDGRDGREDSKDKRRASGSLRGIFRKVFGGGGRKERDAMADRRLASRPQDIAEHEEWMTPDDSIARANAIVNPDCPRDSVRELPTHLARKSLGSHLPFPMNVNAPENTHRRHERPRQSINPSDPALAERTPRRRATMQSVMPTQADISALNAMLDEKKDDSIGLALTSGGGHTSWRRSRSADALLEMVKEHEQMQMSSRRASRADGAANWQASQIETAAPDFDPSHVHFDEKHGKSDRSSGASRRTSNAVPLASHGHDQHADDDDDYGNFDDDSIQRRTPPNERDSFERPSPERTRLRYSSTHLLASHPNASTVSQAAPVPPSALDLAQAQTPRNFSRPVTDSVIRDHLEERLSKMERLTKKADASQQRRSSLSLQQRPVSRTAAQREAGGSAVDLSSRRRMRVQTDFDGQDRRSNALVDSPYSTVHGWSPRTPTFPPTSAPSYSSRHAQPDSDSSQPPPSYSASKMPPTEPALRQLHSSSLYSQSGDSHRSIIAHNVSNGQPINTSSAVPPSPILHSPNIYDHLVPLYAALRYERSKRKEFELLMQQVRHELSDLTTIVRSSQPERSNGDSGAKPGTNTDCNQPNVAPGAGTTGEDLAPSLEDAPDADGAADSLRDGADGEKCGPGEGERPDERLKVEQEQQQSRFSGLDNDSSDDDDEEEEVVVDDATAATTPAVDDAKQAPATPAEDASSTHPPRTTPSPTPLPPPAVPPAVPSSENAPDRTAAGAELAEEQPARQRADGGRSRIPTPTTSTPSSAKKVLDASVVPAQPAPAPPIVASLVTNATAVAVSPTALKNRFGFAGVLAAAK